MLYVTSNLTTMKKLIALTILILITSMIFGQLDAKEIQDTSSFLNLDSIKTKYSKAEIENLILGYWHFVEIKSPKGKSVDISELDNSHHKPFKNTDIRFNENGTYRAEMYYRTGKWEYSLSDGHIVLSFDEPLIYVPAVLDSIDQQTLLEVGVIEPINNENLEISLIDKNQLVIIERLYNDKSSFGYILLYFRKENKMPAGNKNKNH